ncbi:hypothetical protein RW26_17295 [Aeromonas sp. L_1B5_3]|nr:hypothetical protein RW26_17295 [Aeromonas sp. L_1B5_3]
MGDAACQCNAWQQRKGYCLGQNESGRSKKAHPTRPDILDDGPANALVKQQTGYQQASCNATTLRFEGCSTIMEIPARHLSSRIIVCGMEQKLYFRGVH